MGRAPRLDFDKADVWLNVYDILESPFWSQALYSTGLGLHHSAVEVFGRGATCTKRCVPLH